ncbi:MULTISPECIES: acyl-CoA dehydrogenase family protein [Streptomyces]|uniref:Acyl-CoA dehydrogenase family protein n=1 Tax=Streptomyces mirabilis TaxID=68239 RepID=A0ABU3UQN3_9ACTN|nr:MULTISPECIES: acyl-CoA dehydrogenase family protein [Streptomyces]KAF5996215.1 acyl-CoA dehydrogenase [Streptomyces sp. WAC00263]MCX4610180.1 acyl-CoA dehydrogenase family protein [Streptomyces mirabilis]MCZ1000021.1 acyl-CoA dehydrogenase family protein [Streptomyces mirabilis]MDU8996143.1 acyl-CoA dehydrogenase family protein [Streptomyces mirabilis]QDN99391.1 acyl-CoA dehydrogenase [Streptomyces sp. RLB1-9]
MHLAPTERQQRLRAELRTYFRDLMPDGPPPADDPGRQRALLRRIGADGLLGIGWPVAYGGQGRGADEQFVFFDEAYRAGAPVSMVTLNTVGPTLMKYGSEAQKEYFLPRVLSGDLVFAIGYSEPSAGTDLASLRTRAVREGESWLIDGQKIFTSNAQHADWIWLACRTDPDAPKHRGISIVLVPTDAPGFSWTPIETVGGLTTTATYYDGIRVPSSNLVGEENGGWELITNQLNHERVALAAIGMQAEDFYAAALRAARTPDPVTGRRRVDEPWVRFRLAEVHARLAASRLLNWRLVGDVGAGRLAPGDASGVKVAGTESAVASYRMCQEVVGAQALVRSGSPGVFGDGELERMNRAAQINTFGGGVSEVQREIVATMRLGMTRGRR